MYSNYHAVQVNQRSVSIPLFPIGCQLLVADFSSSCSQLKHVKTYWNMRPEGLQDYLGDSPLSIKGHSRGIIFVWFFLLLVPLDVSRPYFHFCFELMKSFQLKGVSTAKVGTRYFFLSPLPLVRYLEIVLPLRAGPLFSKIC
jgi:hypothetical protein